MKNLSYKKENQVFGKPAHNERFGAMAGVSRWKVDEKQQVKWLVASTGNPPLRQAATTLTASRAVQVENN